MAPFLEKVRTSPVGSLNACVSDALGLANAANSSAATRPTITTSIRTARFIDPSERLSSVPKYTFTLRKVGGPGKPRDGKDLSSGRQELEHAANRDAHPIRPVVELVSDLIKRLLQQVGVEENAQLVARFRQMSSGSGHREIRAEKRAADPALPESSSGLELRNILGPDHRSFRLA